VTPSSRPAEAAAQPAPASVGDWDAVAVRSRNGHVLQSRAWGRIRAAQGWRPEELRVGDPLPVALVLWKDVPAGQRIAYVPRGPIFDHREPAQLEAALAALARRAHEERAIFLKVDAEVRRDDRELVDRFSRHGFSRSPQDVQPIVSTLQIDLNRDEEAIFAGLDKDTRWSVRTAGKRGVDVVERRDDEALRGFYRLYVETARRAGFIARPWWYYERVWRTLLDEDNALLLMAILEDSVVAGAMVFWCGERAVYWYGASGDAARRSYASFLLQWRCIRRARERGAALYDMGGIPAEPSERDPMYGVYLFKKGFGGERVDFIGAHDIAPRPVLHRFWLFAEPKAYAILAAISGRRQELG
jgi:peptidoglycan pentaglycine glycine transferase (the first glycine)